LEAMKPITPPKLGGYTGKGFLPGQSGNPGGKMIIPDNIKDAFRKYTLEAIETLAEVMRTGFGLRRLFWSEFMVNLLKCWPRALKRNQLILILLSW
jgi:hypothetical protein